MRVFRSDPKQDTPICATDLEGGYVRYLAARSSDSHAANIEGQDYLAWVSDEDCFCFVICDGVGGSFCGHIAARYLGECLLAFLTKQGSTVLDRQDAKAVADGVRHYLQLWQQEGDRRVNQVRLPEETSALVRQALEQTKLEHGSETVFACGRLSQSLGSERLTLIWMGDTAVRVLDHEGQQIELGGRWESTDRWSTKFGAEKRGAQLWTWVGDVQGMDIERILAFSDGLSFAAEEMHTLDDAGLQRAVNSQMLSASSDDVSFLDFRMKSAGVSSGPGMPLSLRMEGGTLKWEGVAVADGYQVEQATSGTFYGATRVTTTAPYWTPCEEEERQKPAYRSYRVRAVRGDQVGQWSRALWLPPQRLETPALQIREAQSTSGASELVWEEVEGAQYYILCERLGLQAEREIYLGRERQHEIPYSQAIRSSYRVQAWGPAGKSPLGDWVRHPQAPSVPELPESSSVKETVVRQEGESPSKIYLSQLSLESLSDFKVGEPHLIRWSGVRGASFYELQVAAQRFPGGNLSFQLAYRGAAQEYQASYGAPGTYVYRVRARDESELGDWSAQMAIRVERPSLPAAPELYPIENPDGLQSFAIHWSSVEDAEKYELQDKAPGSAEFGRVFGEPPFVKGCNTRVNCASPGVHSYRVRATSPRGVTEFSNIITTEVVVLGSAGQLAGTRREPAGQDARRGGSASALDPSRALRSSAAPAGTMGERATDSGRRAHTAVMTLTVEPGKVPEEYTLRWSGVGGARKYYIEEANNPDFDNVYGRSQWGDSILLPEKRPGTYYYRVCAFDQKGKPDPAQGSNVIRVEVPLGRPTWIVPTLNLSGKGIRVQLSWKSVKWAKSYELTTGTTTEPSEEIDAVPSHQCTYRVPEGTYYFRVRALTEDGMRGEWGKPGCVMVREDKGRRAPDVRWYVLE